MKGNIDTVLILGAHSNEAIALATESWLYAAGFRVRRRPHKYTKTKKIE